MRSRIASAAVAGGLLVGAGLITSVISSPSAAIAQEDPGPAGDRGPIPRVIGFLDEVLADLVEEGTINQDQADAIVAATEERAEEVKAELQERRDLIRELLEDDVITEEEAADLTEDHPLFDDRFDEGWEDGELTREEIRELRPHHAWRHPFRSGFRLGAALGEADDE